MRKKLCDTVAKSLVSNAGYEVDTCYDGDEALDYILTEDYDLIVLDLNLPGMDGMDISERTQSRETRRRRFLSYPHEVRLQIRWKD